MLRDICSVSLQCARLTDRMDRDRAASYPHCGPGPDQEVNSAQRVRHRDRSPSALPAIETANEFSERGIAGRLPAFTRTRDVAQRSHRIPGPLVERQCVADGYAAHVAHSDEHEAAA